MNENKISIKQYEQAADERVSLGGIKWEKKWDVCVQCDSREEAEALRAALAQPEPAECDGGQCGIGGYCKQCPKTQPEPEPVAWMFQNEETGLIECIDTQQVEWGFEKNNPRWQKIAPLYTAPLQREWQNLTDEEKKAIYEKADSENWHDQPLLEAIEAKLKKKNGY
jgi:hypothetical protein